MFKKCICVLLSCLLCVLSLSACAPYSPPEPVLSQKEVDALREKYPIYPVASTGNVIIDTSVPVEEMAAHMETAIYGKVLSERKWKYVSMNGTDHPELEAKREFFTESAGEAVFLCYEMEVIRDAGGKYQPGDKVVFSISEVVEPTIPDFQKGDALIFLGDYSSSMENALENEVGTIFKGIYYVTPDGYALSTCGEEPQTRASGMTADDCVDYLYHLTIQKE